MRGCQDAAHRCAAGCARPRTMHALARARALLSVAFPVPRGAMPRDATGQARRCARRHAHVGQHVARRWRQRQDRATARALESSCQCQSRGESPWRRHVLPLPRAQALLRCVASSTARVVIGRGRCHYDYSSPSLPVPKLRTWSLHGPREDVVGGPSSDAGKSSVDTDCPFWRVR